MGEILKLVGLLVLISVIAVDIFSVRNKNKVLRNRLETQKSEMMAKIKTLEDSINSKTSHHEKKLKDLEEQVRNAENRAGKTENQPKKMVRCNKCSGKGEIQIKKRCTHCGGSGRIQESRTRRSHRHGYYWGEHEKISTIFMDCPHCMPGAMRGSGSKGYTIETKSCPMCNGRGNVEVD